MNNVIWTDGSEVEVQKLHDTEAAIGFEFPDDFAAVVTKNDTGVPHPEVYAGRRFGMLLSVDLERKRNIVNLLQSRGDLFPTGVVPFASGPSGDYLSFDFRRDKSAPTIVLVEHERWEEADQDAFIKPIAKSFSEFVEMLGNQ